MKIAKNVVYLLMVIFSFNVLGSGLFSGVPVREDDPVRLSIAGRGGMVNLPKTDVSPEGSYGFGVQNFGGGLSFTHNVAYDFEYGLGVGLDYYSYGIFNKFYSEAKQYGPNLDITAMFRYMPEIADGLNFGPSISIGWGKWFFAKENTQAEEMSKMVGFGDLTFKAGLGLAYRLGDGCAFHITPKYVLNSIRTFNDKATRAAKETANKHGVEVPVGFMFGMEDGAGVFIEANSMLTNLGAKNLFDSFKEEVTLGLSFAI